MEGVPEVVSYLVQLANALANQRLFKHAACAYASAANESRMSPALQAFCLYKTALHFFLHASSAHHPSAAEDLSRAVQLLHKCNILIRNQPDMFDIRMQIAALLERIHTTNSNALSAAKVINSGLQAIARSQENRADLMKWWLYFRGRAITNAIASGNSVQHAANIAAETAQQCLQYGDSLAAAAFFLAQIHVALANTSPRLSIIPEFERAQQCLGMVAPASPVQRSDVILLSASFQILSALAHFRVGNVAEVGSKIMIRLQESYANLRTLAAADTLRGTWRWLNLEVIAALAFHILSVVRRSNNDVDSRSSTHPSRLGIIGLGKLGVTVKMLPRLTRRDINVPGLSRKAAKMLCIALLEGIARTYLAEGDLEYASTFVSAATKLTFSQRSLRKLIQQAEEEVKVDLSPILEVSVPHMELLQRSAVLLLLSEYHILRADLAGARIATHLLQAIKNLPARMQSDSGEAWITDTWQQAASHLSLLIGTQRNATPFEVNKLDSSSTTAYQDDITSADYTNQQILAMALFTNGIYHLRKPAIIEAQRALDASINILKNVEATNQQAVANVLAVYSGVGMLQLSITRRDCNMTLEATKLARAINDPITLVRTRRQRSKLVRRAGMSNEERMKAEKLVIEAFAIWNLKRSQAPSQILGRADTV